MFTKRIIPCLDVKDGKTVKGVNFENLRDAGDPVELGALYAEQGADELVFLDITATVERRKTLIELVRNVARVINIPFTVGGGISSIQDVSDLLHHGADKISINSFAVKNPQEVYRMAREFGNQCIVVAVDTKFIDGKHYVHTHGGRQKTDIETLAWVKQVVELGAGEILLTSMDHDGVKEGFALELTATVASLVDVPVIASGGAGKKEHFYDVFTHGKADAGLAASIFHFGEIPIPELKQYLYERSIPVRL